jgi:hypothetical protein
MEYFIAETDGSGNPLVNGKEYSVKVGAKGTVKTGMNVTSDVSGVLTSSSVGTPNVGPTSPTVTYWQGGQGTATLKWSPIPNASGYIVFQNDNKTADSADANPTLSGGKITIGAEIVTFEKSGLTNGKEYTFRVVSYTRVGSLTIYSPDFGGAVKSVTPYAEPDKVENLDFTIGSGSINLTWEAPLNSGGAGLNENGPLKYKVLIKDKSSPPVTIVDQDNLTNKTFSQSGSFINNKAYVVSVYAYYTGKNETVYTSSPSTLGTVTPNPPPLNITNLIAEAKDHKVKLSWTNPEDGYLYSRTKIAIWKRVNNGPYKLYRISDPTNTIFEDTVGAKRLPDNTPDSGLPTLYYQSEGQLIDNNTTNISLPDLVNGFTYQYKVTSLFDQSVEGAQQAAPVVSTVVTPSGKPIVDSVSYEAFTGEYVISVTSNGSRLRDWLFMGITLTDTDTPVYRDTVPSTAVGTGNRDTVRQIAGNSKFTIRVLTEKTFDNYLFVINNFAGIEIEASSSITSTP